MDAARQHAFIGTVYALFDYLHCQPSNRVERQRLQRDFQEQTALLGGKFAELAAQTESRRLFPFNDAFWTKVLAAAGELKEPPVNPQAEADLRAEQNKLLPEIKRQAADMEKLDREVTARAKRALYLALAPEDQPGDYTFTELWAGQP